MQNYSFPKISCYPSLPGKMSSSTDYLSLAGVGVTPPQQNQPAESIGVMESGLGHNLVNQVSSSFSSLIHPENLDPPGDYRSSDAEIGSCFLKAALSGYCNTKSITQLSPDDISMGLLFALFLEKPKNVTAQQHSLEIIKTYPIFAESGYQPTKEWALQLSLIHSRHFTGSSYKTFKAKWRKNKR